MTTSIADIMAIAPVIPVLIIDDIATALPIAEALVAGGLPVLEVTLRTPVSLEALSIMSRVTGAVVGAGTVLNPAMLNQAIGAGAQFIVSPGLTEPLAKAAHAASIPLLPGVATASDIMRGLDLGLDRFKFFPAMANGGIPALKALSGPFGKVRFCPTGGITADTAADWLVLSSVGCVGGSWLVKPGDMPDAIEQAARAASMLRLR